MADLFHIEPQRGATQPFRPTQPVAHPGAYQTWTTKTWWRQAGCAEVDCGHFTNGWVTAVDESTDLGKRQADYIRYHSGRVFRQRRTEAGWTAFEFPPGQPCFNTAAHRIQAEREPLYLVQPGDHRGTAGKARVYDRVDQFADDLHNHTDKIVTARSRAGTGN
jgi:hypothetical protein